MTEATCSGRALTQQAEVTAGKSMAFLLVVWAALIGANLVQDLSGAQGDARIWLLDVDVERSLYTWFSQLMLAGAAVLLLDTGNRVLPRDRLTGRYLIFLGCVFILLSIDEALALHELLSSRVKGVVGVASPYLMFAWVIPAGVLCLVGLAASVPFLRRLPVRVRTLMLLSAALFLGGAIGMEMVGGKIFHDHGEDVTVLPYRLAVAVEEGLEGLGVLLFIYSILLYRREKKLVPILHSL